MTTDDRNDGMLPSARDVQVDVVEWRCHTALQDTTSADLLQQRSDALETALETLGGDIPSRGRLFNRIQLAALFVDVSLRPVYSRDDDDDDEYALSTLGLEGWAEFQQQLLLIKTSLLRKDANCVVTQDDSAEGDDDTIDEILAARSKFHSDCDAVVVLLELHQVVARFRQTLRELAGGNRIRSILRQVEAAVDDYKESIKQLRADNAISIESEERLTSFLLADMYKAKTKDLPQRLYQDLETVMANESEEFSYTHTRSKLLKLLQRWHACVLSVPTLVRLGYYGAAARKMSMDSNASVSSWGVDDDEYKERQAVLDDAPMTPEAVTVPPQSSADDDTDEYATADEAEAAAAFEFCTQPTRQNPMDNDDDDNDESDAFPKPTEKEQQEGKEEEPDESDESYDKDKKPKTKPTQPRESSPSPAKKLPPRSARLVGESAATEPARRLSRTSKKAASSRRRSSRVPGTQCQSQKADAGDDGDESITDPESLPTMKAAGSRKPARSAKRTTVIEWSSESEDEFSMTEAPRKRAAAQKTRTTTPKRVKVQKRRPFSDEEREAVRAGVRRFGVGQWATIRLNSGGILLSRTNVNLKDCYRNMLNRGEG